MLLGFCAPTLGLHKLYGTTLCDWLSPGKSYLRTSMMVKPMVAPCFLKLPSRDIIMFPLRCCRIWYRLNQMRPPFGSFGYIWCKKHWIQSLLPLSSAVHSGPCWLCKDQDPHPDYPSIYDIWLVVYLPLWKNISQLGWLFIPYIWKKKKCSKPPTRHSESLWQQLAY